MNGVRIFTEMIGLVFDSVTSDGNQLIFKGGRSFKFYHDQDCCESVRIEDICGELSDLVDSPIVMAEEVSSIDGFDDSRAIDDWDDSFTWTFYKFATAKGGVTVRFYCTSNGYYSERVSFYDLDNGKIIY